MGQMRQLSLMRIDEAQGMESQGTADTGTKLSQWTQAEALGEPLTSWDLLHSPVLHPDEATCTPSQRAGQPCGQSAAHVQRFSFELVHRSEQALDDCGSAWTMVARQKPPGLGPWSTNWVMVDQAEAAGSWELIRGANRFQSPDTCPEVPPTQNFPENKWRGRSRCTRDSPSWALGQAGVIRHVLQELRYLPNRSRDLWSELQKAGKSCRPGPRETQFEGREQSFEESDQVHLAKSVRSEETCSGTRASDAQTPSPAAAGVESGNLEQAEEAAPVPGAIATKCRVLGSPETPELIDESLLGLALGLQELVLERSDTIGCLAQAS